MIELENSPALIRECSVETEVNGERLCCVGSLLIQTGGSPKIHCHADYQTTNAVHALASIDSPTPLPLYIDGLRIDALVVGVGGDIVSGQLKISWQPNPQPISTLGGPDTQLTKVEFTIANIPNLVSSKKIFFNDGDKKWCEFCLELEFCGFKVEVIPISDLRERLARLKENGGYVSTHLGTMSRVDGAEFSADQAIDMLHGLFKYLSFVRGCEIKPVVPSGYDASGKLCWEWLVPPADAFTTSHSLLDPHAGRYVESLCPIFMGRWFDPAWRTALGESVFWYLDCNRSSLNKAGAVVLIQAALERLAYFYLVETEEIYTRKQFKKIPAGESTAEFLTRNQIPVGIPPACEALVALAKSNCYSHAPHAITSVRNQYVHPRTDRSLTGLQVYDAWNLAMWLVEMSILRLCGYNEKYSTRLESRWLGEYKDVPWTARA